MDQWVDLNALFLFFQFHCLPVYFINFLGFFSTSDFSCKAIFYQNLQFIFISSPSYSIGVNVLRGHAGLYRLSRFYSVPRSRIVSPCYGRTVHCGLEPMTDRLLSRSLTLYHGKKIISSCDKNQTRTLITFEKQLR